MSDIRGMKTTLPSPFPVKIVASITISSVTLQTMSPFPQFIGRVLINDLMYTFILLCKTKAIIFIVRYNMCVCFCMFRHNCETHIAIYLYIYDLQSGKETA